MAAEAKVKALERELNFEKTARMDAEAKAAEELESYKNAYREELSKVQVLEKKFADAEARIAKLSDDCRIAIEEKNTEIEDMKSQVEEAKANKKASDDKAMRIMSLIQTKEPRAWNMDEKVDNLVKNRTELFNTYLDAQRNIIRCAAERLISGAYMTETEMHAANEIVDIKCMPEFCITRKYTMYHYCPNSNIIGRTETEIEKYFVAQEIVDYLGSKNLEIHLVFRGKMYPFYYVEDGGNPERLEFKKNLNNNKEYNNMVWTMGKEVAKRYEGLHELTYGGYGKQDTSFGVKSGNFLDNTYCGQTSTEQLPVIELTPMFKGDIESVSLVLKFKCE